MTARSEALQVFLRVRPPIMKEVRQENAVMVRNSQTVTLMDDKKETTCSYDYIFNEVSEQEQVFEKVKPLLEDVLSGVNACIFAYGQTSAGKSYTMIGPNGGQDIFRRDADEWGILPRASEFLLGYLNEKAMEGVLSYEVKASFLQIYNENLYDLLRDTGPMIEDKLVLDSKDKDSDLKIREIPRRKNRNGEALSSEVFVAGLSEFRVQTSEDILRILAVGANNRMTRSTDFNATSSRSHALLQLTFEIEAQTESGQTVINKSKLNLVDLAGSEKIPFVASEFNNARHMKELTSINKSLSSLGNVIAALSSNNRSHIPYRDSKLTRILQDSLSGNTRTILLACVAPTVLHTSETLSTLQFADRAKNVMLSVKPNTLVDDKLLLTKAHGEITRLKTLLTHALKQLEQRGQNGGSDPADLMRLQEENEALRRDNAALKKTLKSQQPTGMQPPGQSSVSPVLFDQHMQQMQMQQQQQPQVTLPYLNYSATNPTLPTHQQMGAGMPGSLSSNASNGGFSLGNMSVDSMMSNNNKLGKNWPEQDNGKKGKKQSKARNVPPLFDLLDAGVHGQGGNAGNGKSKNKKSEAPSGAKLHSKAYKSINDRQIEELNGMLSAANVQSQQQNMMQYLQQQQFMQQSFPHQQLNLPYIGQPNNPAPQMSQAMASVNAMAASIMQPNAYNTNGYNTNGGYQVGIPVNQNNQVNQNQGVQNNNVYRPAPVHLGAPYQAHYNPVPSDPNYYNTNNSASMGGVVLPIIPSATSNPNLTAQGQGQGHDHGHVQGQGHRYPDERQTDISPTTKEPAPHGGGHGKHRDRDRDRDRDREREREADVQDTTRSRSDDPADHHHHAAVQHAPSPIRPQPSNESLTGRSALGSSHGQTDTGRLGTGQTSLGTPGGHSGAGSKMPANRIVRKNNAGAKLATHSGDEVSDEESEYSSHHQQRGRAGGESDGGGGSVKGKPGSSSSAAGGGVGSANGGATSQHAFLANIMNRQAQQGTPSGLMQSSATIEPPIQRSANLSHTSDDVGRAVQLFSFRMNTWDRIQIVEYDSVKRQHKCRHSDGAEQWLDLTKKPIRAIPEM